MHRRDCSSSTVFKTAQALEMKEQWHLHVESAVYLEPNEAVGEPHSARRSSSSIPAATVVPWALLLPCFLLRHSLVLSTEPPVLSPKGLQFSPSLHIPHIFTCVKGKQLCRIFSLTSWKEKQRKLKSEVLFCTIERINDAFPTSSTFPSKLTC